MSNQLFFLSLADIFSVYPAIFKEVSKQLRKTKQIYLPSDEEWQDKMYYMLLDIQRQVNEQNDENVSLTNIDKREKPIFDPERITKIILSPATSPSGRRSRVLKHCHDMTVRVKLRTSSRWNLPTIANAAKLLRKPPLPVTFQNEHEMRLAYSLIYDVFRCKLGRIGSPHSLTLSLSLFADKSVLCNALSDIKFFELEQHQQVGT